ncbi:hypothetical protein [Corynebacterium sp. A21]|uniref:hypothetical protein n=1 Tax=Corynebacterium sp. A21 TaxID=3457318 RepID=UPI003FCF37AA
MIYTEIDYRLDDEEDPLRRKRLEQFIIEVVRGMPTLPVDQAVQVALQTDRLVDIYSCANLTQVIQKAWQLPLYAASEWRLLGYTPKSGATPIHLDIPREWPGTQSRQTEAHYLYQDMYQAPGMVAMIDTGSAHRGTGGSVLSFTRSWERRLVKDAAARGVYADLEPGLPRHCIAMLGNLWKVGAVVDWSGELGNATSRQRVNPGAVTRVPLSPQLQRRAAWYTLDINDTLGTEIFAEVCLCLASILMGYSPQVWHNAYVIPLRGPLRLLECEAVSYIVCSRLGAPRRRSCTEFFLTHSDAEEELPEDFDWGRVLRTAALVEDLLRGDTGPVWVDTGATLRGE